MKRAVRFASCLGVWLLVSSFLPARLLPSGLAAGSVPYQDPNAKGTIDLCDKNGKPITHGNINDRPFVWLSMSSSPASSPFDQYGKSATLLAYQPRQGFDPGNWSGDMLTAASYYTNPGHPLVVATSDAASLKDFLNTYPLKWNGLVELRMYLGAPGQGVYSATYPTTDIQVSGDTWGVVRGGGSACDAGYAVTAENGAQPPTSTATTSPPPPPSATNPAPSGQPGAQNSGNPSPGSSLDPGATSTPGGSGTGTPNSSNSPTATRGESRSVTQSAAGRNGRSDKGNILVDSLVGLVIAGLLLGGFLATRARGRRGREKTPN